DADGGLLWSVRFGGNDDQIVGALALDGRGDAVVTASVTGVTPEEPTGATATDCLIKKLAGADGRTLWSTEVHSTGNQLCRAVASNDAGDVFVASAFEHHADFGERLDSHGKHDIWLAAFSGSDGALRWVRQIGGKGNEIVRTLAVDRAGDVLLGGQF